MTRLILVVGLGLGILGMILAAQRWVFSTHYAPGYSRGAFKEIHEGDDASRVQHAVGEPLRKYEVKKNSGSSNVWTIWEYSAPGRAWFYQVRCLIFSNDVVVTKMDTSSWR